MAILQGIVDGLVFIDNSQSGFVPERHYRINIFGSTNAGEMPNCEQTLLLALEKAFISAPRICIWWELRQLCYSGSKNQCVKPCLCCYGYSKEFTLNVGVHHGSVLSPLLFIIVLEALSRMFRSGAHKEDIYANHLVIITESLEEYVRRLLI